jgi:intracellular sulfur oxidation DsrE/DsrF family protein
MFRRGIENCLSNGRIKIVYQVNQRCFTPTCSKNRPFAFGNIQNHIKDLNKHGYQVNKDFEIHAIVYGQGWPLIVNDHRNPYKKVVQSTIDSGVKISLCLTTAWNVGLEYSELLPEVGFVTSGVSAIVDLQSLGWIYIQP